MSCMNQWSLYNITVYTNYIKSTTRGFLHSRDVSRHAVPFFRPQLSNTEVHQIDQGITCLDQKLVQVKRSSNFKSTYLQYGKFSPFFSETPFFWKQSQLAPPHSWCDGKGTPPRDSPQKPGWKPWAVQGGTLGCFVPGISSCRFFVGGHPLKENRVILGNRCLLRIWFWGKLRLIVVPIHNDWFVFKHATFGGLWLQNHKSLRFD